VPALTPGDALNGVKEIHAYWIELTGRRQSISTTFLQVSRGLIPAHRFGKLYIGSRKGIARHLATGTGLGS
jgi:hypothetical protein